MTNATPPADASPTGEQTPAHLTRTVVHAADRHDAWWRQAVIYQIYPRSWADSDGDGIGDLPGITARLDYLRDLGVDALWLSPFYVSPMNDAGYDVANYRDVDPCFGSLGDADTLIRRAHDLGLKVIIDLVPNHSSSTHPWFQAALAAQPGSQERARYLFRDGRGEHGEAPPNNWASVFGGRGWSRVTETDGEPGQWYLHLFDATQPDYDWRNAEVRAEFEAILAFWLDRDVDGFRVDVAHSLIKAESLPDWDGPATLEALFATSTLTPDTPRPPMWDQDGVHEVYRSWRSLVDGYGPGERILCAEAWVQPLERLARYVRPDEMHQAFNFDFLETPRRADRLRAVIAGSLAANDAVGAPTTWVLSNHDVVRHATRLGLDQDGPRPNGIGANDPQPDVALGLRRARAASLLMLALPGGAYLYQGEELGLPDHTTMPDEARHDPTFASTGGAVLGRDGCRVPMPWRAEAPSFGFGPSERTWLPQPAAYRAYAVDQQDGVPGSTLELYRHALHMRRERGIGLAGLDLIDGLGEDVVAVQLTAADGTVTTAVANLGATQVDLPPELGDILLASAPVDTEGTLPVDTTAWLGRSDNAAPAIPDRGVA